jgi:hypothetical protein
MRPFRRPRRLHEADVRLNARPKRRLLVLAAATGLAPVPVRGARDSEISGRRDPQGAAPCEYR